MVILQDYKRAVSKSPALTGGTFNCKPKLCRSEGLNLRKLMKKIKQSIEVS